MKTLPFVFLFAGCIGTGTIVGTSGLSQSELASIPHRATEVIVTGQDRAQLYDRIVDALIQRGHRIGHEDKERFYLTTEGKDVGQSTLQRMSIVVNDKAEAVIKTEWMPGMFATMIATGASGLDVDGSWEVAKYEGSRLGIAFAESVAVAKATGGVISYK